MILRIVAVAFACFFAFGVAGARADYPDRPIRILVGFAPGGPTDILARLIGQWLTDRFGQQVVIENKPGAGGNIATEAAVNAPADGYTLLVLATANAINATYYKKLPLRFSARHYRRRRAGAGTRASWKSIRPYLSKSVAELIAYAKANPAKINVASGGSGTTAHLAIELLKAQTQLDLVHVPYRGLAPALTDLHQRTGADDVRRHLVIACAYQVRRAAPAGVTTAQRTAVLPDVPTVAETLPGYEASAWFGIGVPKGTPAAIVERLNAEINAGLKDPKISARIVELGATPLGRCRWRSMASFWSPRRRNGRAR